MIFDKMFYNHIKGNTILTIKAINTGKNRN